MALDFTLFFLLVSGTASSALASAMRWHYISRDHNRGGSFVGFIWSERGNGSNAKLHVSEAQPSVLGEVGPGNGRPPCSFKKLGIIGENYPVIMDIKQLDPLL